MIFGLGTDIIEVDRIRKEISKESGLKEKVFAPAEIEYCESKNDKAQHYAARFAAKEAFFKALGTGWGHGIEFQDVMVLNNVQGRPEIKLKGKAHDFFKSNNLKNIQLSMSHIKELASAFVIIEK
jgi:holo-[acyl-carrier protein] synthase